jgi:hypothetical protein
VDHSQTECTYEVQEPRVTHLDPVDEDLDPTIVTKQLESVAEAVKDIVDQLHGFDTTARRWGRRFSMIWMRRGMRPAPTTIFPPAACDARKITKDRRASTKEWGRVDSGVATSATVLRSNAISVPWFTPAFTAAKTSCTLVRYLATHPM